MNTWLYPGWTQADDDTPRETECPTCGGTEHQTEDDGHRICWECGTRWSA